MPIRYRCPDCRQLLSIATRMVGQTVNCPTCGAVTTVPEHDDPLLAAGQEADPPPDPDQQTLPPAAAHPPDIPPRERLEGDRLRKELPVREFDSGAAAGLDVPGVSSSGSGELADSGSGSFSESRSAALKSARVFREWIDAARPPEQSSQDDATASPPCDDRAPSMSGGEGEASSEADADAPNPAGGFTFGRRRMDTEEMDLTPMVDMTFLLLIFFMITASFQLQKSIEVPPPSPEEKGAAQTVHSLDDLESTSVIVRVDENNAIFVDDEPVADRSRLSQALRSTMRSTRKTELILSAADGAFHETVVAVIDAANEVGMQKIRLATHAGGGS